MKSSVLVLIILLFIGVAAGGGAAAAVLRETAAVLFLPLMHADGQLDPSMRARWLRACLLTPRCRRAAAFTVAAAVTRQARLWWVALLSFTAAFAWGTAVRIGTGRAGSWAGGARFACRADLRRLVRGAAGGWFPLGYVARWPADLPARLPEEDLARHVMVVGVTGAHKTTAVTFPVLLEASRAGVSVVALDLKYGEDDSLARAAPEWHRSGRDVLVFAPLDPMSLRWNPLAGCRTIGDAHRLAALLFDDDDSGNPDLLYWMGAERHLCAALSLALATDGGPPTLERLRALCEGGPSAVHAYVQIHPAARILETRLGTYRAMLPKDEAGILQGIASRLEAWGDETICRNTGIGPAADSVDLGRLRREPLLLIVGIPQSALGRLRWLWQLFLRDLASRLLRPRRPDERIRVVQVAEELPAWGRLPGFADHLATFRSRDVSVLVTIQSEAQGEHVYGREGWAAIAANLGTKIFFPLLSDLDAERLSRALGTTSGYDLARSRGWGAGGRRGGEHQRTVPVPLRRPEELQGIGAADDEILVRCPRLPPAQLRCPPFYLRPEYRGRVPDVPPSTAELVVYHHLWHRRAQGERPGVPEPRTLSRVVDTPSQVADAPVTPTSVGIAGRSEPRSGASSPTMPAPSMEVTPAASSIGSSGSLSAGTKDLEALAQFIHRLVAAHTDWHRASLRAIHHASRLVEVRVDHRVAVPLCGDPETVDTTLRRWAVLRWVRRVRPVFVLERRALDALDPALRSRLAAACALHEAARNVASPATSTRC